MKTNPKRSAFNQLIFILIIFAFAVLTWFNNEEKAQKPQPQQKEVATKIEQPKPPQPKPEHPKSELPELKQPKSTTNVKAALPSSLGNYDTIMANDNLGQNTRAGVDYYQLALSWSPSFCEWQKRKNNGETPKHLSYQCDNAEKFGWVIHGLWPQAEGATTPAEHPRFCQGDLPPLSESLIKHYMPESPGAKLLQGQWEKHGACAFHSADSYFEKQKALFLQLKLPEQAMSRKELFTWLKKHNPQLKNAYLGATQNELYICYDKQWNVIDCPKR